jgi:tetratricopeptide (TPR) repeat protein
MTAALSQAAWLGGAWLAEGGAAVAAITGAGLLVAGGLHAVAAGLAALALGERRRDGRLFAGALVFSVPVVGLAGLCLMHLWLVRARPSQLFATAHAQLAELPAPARAPESLDRVFEWLQAQVSVRPLADLIRTGDAKTQRWAIDLLARRSDSAAVQLLREALQAEDRDIQIAASAALARIEERLADQVSRARERVRQGPDSASAWAALGDACRAYRESWLLDPVLERHWLLEAEHAYREALALAPGARAVALSLARVLLAEGRVEEAEAEARRVWETAPGLDADLLLGEILFAQGKWGELRGLARAAVEAGRRDDLLTWWAGPS